MGGAGELGESTLKAGVIREVNTPMDCGRCRGLGRVADVSGTGCGVEDWLSCSHLFILPPEL